MAQEENFLKKSFRTDLACESRDVWLRTRGAALAGVSARQETRDGLGVETVEILDEGAAKELCKPMGRYVTISLDALVRPDRVIAVDALSAREAARLCRAVQVTDAGIVPGSGVGNARSALTEETLGVPVVAVGVPTVVDARTLCADLSGAEIDLPEDTELFVTPRDIDTRVRDSARLVGYAIDLALHDTLTIEDIDMFLA